MKTVCLCGLGAVILFVSGCSSAESHYRAGYDFGQLDRVAVVDVLGHIEGEAAKNQIADFFVMELLKKGYAPVERAQVQSILKEQQFQSTGVTSKEEVAKTGRILNVPTILVVNIPKFDEEMNMTAKLLDVEDGSILWMGTGSGTTGRTLSTIFGAAAGVGAAAATAGDDDRVLAGVAGGVLGGVAGRALSPQDADKAQEIIKKMCKTLPCRLSGMKDSRK